MKIWCYEDAHNWGAMLHKQALERGHDARLFENPRVPDSGYVFMHMHHHPQVRTLHKRCMQMMAMNPHLILIPNYRSSFLYDDKLEQARQFARWMPRTHVFYTPGAARRFLDTLPTIPFMSKSSEGASSHNVRFVTSLEQARLEIKYAFSDIGIKGRYNQTQRGYLLWQEFVEGNDSDIRVLAIGNQRLILKRMNRDDRPMASGSGNIVPVTALDEETASALEAANEFFVAESMPWCGIDLVRNQVTKQWRILEATVSWTMHGYYECQFVGTQLMGSDVWHVLLDEIENGAFG